MKIEEILQRDERFRYMLLSRMRCDCDYYLHFSDHPKRLWTHNEYKQIEYMKAIWESFPANGKPEWLSMQRIEYYERKMTPWLGDTPRETLGNIEPFYAGSLFFMYDRKRMKPNRVWFSCQITGQTMGGYAYIHYDNVLHPVYIDYGERYEQYFQKGFRNVTCDCDDGYLSNFRKE